jgi:ribosome biogenesis protein MAK21
LQAQLKSLGLNGKFPDVSSDDEEEAAESNWTDEEEDVEDDEDEDGSDSPTPPPPKAAQKKATLSNNEKSITSKTIDRPVQLSIPSKPEAKPVGLARNRKLRLEPHSLWYEIERPPVTPNASTPNAEIVAHLHARGKVLLQTESDNYMTSNHITSSDRQFLSTIMTSGTQSDKLSALTLAISASPLHCQKQLEALLGMAKKKSRNEAVQAVAALKDLLTGNLLPDRKLLYFGKQPGLESSAKDEALILWTFEDWLKGWYFQVLQVIEV